MATQWPTFHGRKGESAAEYIEDIQVNVDLSEITGNDTTANRVSRGKFRTGLRGEARDWWRMEYTGDREDYEHIKKTFMERFPPTTLSNSAAIMQQAVSFERHGGEPLEDYLKRADRLHRKITSSEIREVLASRLLKSMCDGEKDSALRTRVIDRLHAQNKVVVTGGVDCLDKSTTFKDVHDTILACTRQFGAGDQDGGDEDHPDGDETTRLERIITTMTEKLANVVTAAMSHNQPPPNRNPNHRVLYDPNTTSPQSAPGYRTGAPPATQANGRKWWCDWCGLEECDHPTFNCPHQGGKDDSVRFTNMRRRIARQEARSASTPGYSTPGSATPGTSTPGHGSSGTHPQVSSLTLTMPSFINALSPQDARAYQAEFSSLGKKMEAIDDAVMAVRRPGVPKTTLKSAMSKPSDKVRKPTVPKKVHISEEVVEKYLHDGDLRTDGEDKEAEDEGADAGDMPDALPPVMELPDLRPRVEDVSDQVDEERGAEEMDMDTDVPVQEHILERVIDEFDKKMREAVGSAPPLQHASPVGQTSPSTPIHGDMAGENVLDGDVRPRSHISGLAKTGQTPFDIGEALADVHLDIGLLQLLDAAPRVRTELAKLIAAETHGNRKKTPSPITTTMPVPTLKSISHFEMAMSDGVRVRGRGIGRDEVGTVSSCFVTGYARGIKSDRFMIDSGATLECVSPQFCDKMGMVPSTLEVPWRVTLANDCSDLLSKYIVVNFIVGGVSTAVVAFVYGNGSFDVMLSNSWLVRVRAIQNWGTKAITIHTRDGSPETIPFTISRAPDTLVELVETPETFAERQPEPPKILVTRDRIVDILASLGSASTDSRITELGKVLTQC